MNKVLIPTKLSDVAANTLKTAGYEVIQDADTPLEKQVAAHPDAVALIVRSEKVTPEIMDALPSLKLVVRAGAGYDNIDIVYARKKNVDVMNTPGANSNAVAEEVMAMILAYYRHIVQADATTREGLWEKKKYMGSELTKKTVGIIGLGNIGRNNKMFYFPMIFMLVVTLTSLAQTAIAKVNTISANGATTAPVIQLVLAVVLFVLALVLAVEACQTIFGHKKPAASK